MTDKPDLRHKLTADGFVGDREAWILRQAKGQRVLHVGCADVGFLEYKLDTERFLHARLANVCSALTGIETDASGIQQLRSLGYRHLICRDISEDHRGVIREVGEFMHGCDLIVCGEVLEHVLNYGRLLVGIREVARAYGATVIITVPNSFSLESFLSVIRGVEEVHTDHKCYFSQVTLNTLLAQTGFRSCGTYFYSRDWVSSTAKRIIKRIISKTLFARRPQLAEGLIAVVKPAEELKSEYRNNKI